VYLGYGFENPRPGLWQITLQATDLTPDSGADFAITALFNGGASLRGQASPLVAGPGEAVNLSVRFDPPVDGIQIEQARATIHMPGGNSESIELIVQGERAQGAWTPPESGLHGIDLVVTARLADGTLIDRASYLSVVSQPAIQPQRIYLILIVLICLLVLIGTGFLFIFIRVLRRPKRSPV